MIAAQNVSVSFGAQTVLADAHATVSPDARAGLVGANGSGKSTLLKVLAGVRRPDAGTVQRARGTTVAYLPQHLDFDAGRIIRSETERAFDALRMVAERRERVALTLAERPTANQDKLLTELAELDHLLEESDYHQRDHKIGRVLSGLGFAVDEQSNQMGTLSGGRQMRVALAKVLLSGADTLLLDEPTNYLDTEARAWLLAFLVSYRGAVVIVSHDRAFLDELTRETLEVFQGRLRRFSGNYSRYLKLRNQQIAHLVGRYEQLEREREQHERFIARFRANASKARQVQSRVRLLEKMERIELPEHLKPIHVRIPPAPRSGNDVLRFESLSRLYGSTPALVDVDLALGRGERLAVVGPNGAGKSTFLRICAGHDREYQGSRSLGTGVEVAYFAQDSTESLPEDQTVLDFCRSRAPYEALPFVRDLLGAFLFSGDAVEKPLGVLSGGERTRAVLASLFLRPANLLVLDEPTNHLDITSKEVLAEALRSYDGTAVVVSHDRYFLGRVSTSVLAFHPPAGKRNWRHYPGDYQYYVTQVAQASEDQNRPVSTPVLPRGDGRAGFERQKAIRRERDALERREKTLLGEIDEVEGRRAELEQRLADPELYRMPGDTRVREVARELEDTTARERRLHREWESVAEALSSMPDTIEQ